MINLIKNKVILLIIIWGIFIIFSEVLALETAWPSSPLGTQLTGQSQLSELVRYFYEWGIALGGLAAFIALIMAGFSYLTSVGEPAKMKEAQDKISSAFFGLILLLSSWLILNAINPQLTVISPIALDLEAVFTSCKVDADCPEKDYQCREGICFPKIKETTVEPCTSVKLYRGYDFLGEMISVEKNHGCINIYSEGKLGGQVYDATVGFGAVHSEVKSTQGFVNGKKDGTCGGNIRFYSRLHCTGPFIILSPTNQRIDIDIDFEKRARSVRFSPSF